MTRPLIRSSRWACWAAGAAAPAVASTRVDYGPISHSGLKKLGAAPTGDKLTLQLGFIANQSGLQSAVKSASNPASSSYGKYPSLSTLASKYGASSSKRNAVVNAFKKQGVTAKVDVTHLRATATVSIGKAQTMFGTKWAVYVSSTGSHVALPVNTPKLPSGINGNVDTVAGMRLQLTSGVLEPRGALVSDGGTPTRTGTPDPGCSEHDFPQRAGLRQRPVPEPDPHRLRHRAAAGGGPAGPGRAAGDRRRGPDARPPTSTRSARASGPPARR